MPRKPGKQGPEDTNELAFRIVQEAVDGADAAQGPETVIGQAGGKVGGRARAKKLSARRRSEIARNAARARWQHS